MCYYQLLTVIRRLLDSIELHSTCIPNVYYHPNAYFTCTPYGSCSFWTELVVYNRPLPWCSKPLFQSEARCEAIDVKMIYYIYILMQIKLLFTRKVLHLPSFWKWEFLELGNGLFSWLYTSAWTIFWVFLWLIPNDEFYSKRAFLVYIILVYIANMVVCGNFFLYQVFILKAV